MRQHFRRICPEMSAAAFPAEQAGLEHQSAGEQPVVQIQKQIQVPATAVAEQT